MLNRQDSSLSASRRQATATPPPESRRAKSVGCMSGIFHLLSKYQNPNKRLTFGRRQVKSSKHKSSVKPKSEQKQHPAGTDIITSTCDIIKVSRSPTLPAELRRSTDANPPTERPRMPPPSSLVKRLMGLDDITAIKSQTSQNHHQEAAVGDHSSKEKRQKLLEALEKCNHDLEALKRIIVALQSADVAAKSGGGGNTEVRLPCMGISCTDQNAKLQNSTFTGLKSVQQHRRPITLAKKPGEDEEAVDKLFNNPTLQLSAKYSSSLSSSLVSRRSSPQCSRAMVGTVEEVCKDIAWGEKRETDRLGLALQDYVCKDLIEELVKELEEKSRSCCLHSSSSLVLPHVACKRMLRF